MAFNIGIQPCSECLFDLKLLTQFHPEYCTAISLITYELLIMDKGKLFLVGHKDQESSGI